MWASPTTVSHILASQHYLGASKRGMAWHDKFGVIVIAHPTARRLPTTWVELTRWCITSKEDNAGSRQWASFSRALREARPHVTTVVSYSDPSVGHTGALYRACNWLWAPTWHRLRPPPSGNGAWTAGKAQSVKDRWVFPLKDDPERVARLRVRDDAVLRRFPWAVYSEPKGASFKTWVFMKEVAA